MSKVIIGEALEELQKLPTDSIDLIITSPPYYNQRDYGTYKQIGLENTETEYLDKLLSIFSEAKRVLKDTGSFFLNIGDKYNKKGLSLLPHKLAILLTENGWILRNEIIWHKPNHMPSSVKDRFACSWEPIFFLVKDTGKYYTSKYFSNIDVLREEPVSEEKKIPFPYELSVEEYETNINDIKNKLDLYNREKNKKYKGKYKNTDTINIGSSPAGRSSKDITYSKQRKYKIEDDKKIEIISYLKDKRISSGITSKQLDEAFGYKDTAGHWFRTDRGGSLPKPQDYMRLKELLCLGNQYDEIMISEQYVLQVVKNNKNGKTPEDMWSISLEKNTKQHFAIFPFELPYKIIKAFCPDKGVVLDMFAGSGTTGKAAKILDRNYILIELNPEYESMIQETLQ